jgi:hypothetical protein
MAIQSFPLLAISHVSTNSSVRRQYRAVPCSQKVVTSSVLFFLIAKVQVSLDASAKTTVIAVAAVKEIIVLMEDSAVQSPLAK